MNSLSVTAIDFEITNEAVELIKGSDDSGAQDWPCVDFEIFESSSGDLTAFITQDASDGKPETVISKFDISRDSAVYLLGFLRSYLDKNPVF